MHVHVYPNQILRFMARWAEYQCLRVSVQTKERIISFLSFENYTKQINFVTNTHQNFKLDQKLHIVLSSETWQALPAHIVVGKKNMSKTLQSVYKLLVLDYKTTKQNTPNSLNKQYFVTSAKLANFDTIAH